MVLQCISRVIYRILVSNVHIHTLYVQQKMDTEDQQPMVYAVVDKSKKSTKKDSKQQKACNCHVTDMHMLF